MKTFTEIVKEERSTSYMSRRRDQRNEEGKLTKAQREVQGMCAYQLWGWLCFWETCDTLVRRGELHPLQHPYRNLIDAIDIEQKLRPHPATRAHPLAVI